MINSQHKQNKLIEKNLFTTHGGENERRELVVIADQHETVGKKERADAGRQSQLRGLIDDAIVEPLRSNSLQDRPSIFTRPRFEISQHRYRGKEFVSDAEASGGPDLLTIEEGGEGGHRVVHAFGQGHVAHFRCHFL